MTKKIKYYSEQQIQRCEQLADHYAEYRYRYDRDDELYFDWYKYAFDGYLKKCKPLEVGAYRTDFEMQVSTQTELDKLVAEFHRTSNGIKVNQLITKYTERICGIAKYHYWYDMPAEELASTTDTSTHQAPNYYVDENGHDLFWHFSNGLLTADEYAGFLIGNAMKYTTRRGKKDKDKRIEDIQKAIDNLQELKRFESGEYGE